MDVEIWSDIACPWCYVGKRHLEEALERFEHRDEVTVTWRSFELDPGAPAERGGPGEGAIHLAKKYGTTLEKAREMEQRMTETAAEDGLEFRFDRLRMGSTFDAHRIVHLAQEHGRQDAMKERLMLAYLTEGELMSDHATLRRLAGEVGLPEDEVVEVLATERFAEEVREDERTASAFGASAVPFFVVDRALGASGAHPADALLQLLQQGWDAKPRMQVVTGGEACGPEGC
ncbi:MAG: oxidoreductase [Solirubrobacterales bacterium]|jgi:predicted DsbA family dithiol-disulfide isomerase|nr:oxidoreductase [Solirubrobacterales bacterium]